MDMQTTSKVLPNERKQSERRRKWMEAAVSIAQDVANHHDWEEVLKSSKAKVDPCKFFCHFKKCLLTHFCNVQTNT